MLRLSSRGEHRVLMSTESIGTGYNPYLRHCDNLKPVRRPLYFLDDKRQRQIGLPYDVRR